MSDYTCSVLADSLSPDGVRLTTVMVRFPRFILAEVNTHRMLSRNSASSRAIPTEQLIEKVRTDPFVPASFNQRVRGMGVGEEFTSVAADVARSQWIQAASNAADFAERLMEIGLDKSRANRLLEPFLWHTAVITATEWEHFFALRQPADGPVPNLDFPAQPEIQVMARSIRDALETSTPQRLEHGWWHLPTATVIELAFLCAARVPFERAIRLQHLKRVCAGRLARWTSYDNQGDEPAERSWERAQGLMANYHMSPFEHVARPLAMEDYEGENALHAVMGIPHDDDHEGEMTPAYVFCGNLRGWVQMRKEIPNEHNAALAEAEA